MLLNTLISIVSSFVLILACFYIANIVNKKKKLNLYSISDKTTNSFLYSELSPFSIVISNVGSMSSFYVLIVGNILMSFGWGSLLTIGSIVGIISSQIFLYFLIMRFLKIKNRGDLTYVDIVQRMAGNGFALFSIVLMGFYAIATIGSEINAIKILYESIGSANTNSLINGVFESRYFQINIFMLIMCIVYVIKGGYLGAVRTDILQFVLLVFLWLAGLFMFGIDFSLINKHFVINGTSIAAAIATVLLIIGWVLSTLDFWIRVVGSISDRSFISKEGLKTDRKNLKYIMLATILLSVFLVSIPSYIGLKLRDVTISTIEKAPASERYYPKLKESVLVLKPLEQRGGDDKNGAYTAPSVVRNRPNGYKRYSEFTNSPFVFLSISLKEYYNSLKSQSSYFRFIFIVSIIFITALTAALTTIDTLIILIGQLCYKLSKGKLSSIDKKELLHPRVTIIATTFLMLVISIIPFYRDGFYFSAGIFAWSCMVFLAGITLVSIYHYQSGKFIKRFVKTLIWFFTGWFLFFVIPHFILMFYEESSSFLLSDFIRQRYSIVLTAFGSVLLTYLIAYSLQKDLSDTNIGLEG